MKDLSGSVAVTITPFLTENEPNYEEIKKQTEFLCNSSVAGIFPNTSTGEYPKLWIEDKIEVLRVVAEQNKGRKLLFAGACGASNDEVKYYITKARELGYDACVVCPPYYYPLSQKNIIDFYRDVCAFDPEMPIVAYNVPFFTTEITLDTFAELMEIENLIGMKDSSGNMKKISHECDIARKRKDNFVLYSGTDDCLLSALVAGCTGSMTALAAIIPEHIAEIYKYKEDFHRALWTQRKILEPIRVCDSILFPYGYKLLAKIYGCEVGDIPCIVRPEDVEKCYGELVKCKGILDE